LFLLKTTGSISRASVIRQADKYKRFAEQCRELAKPLSGQLKQTLQPGSITDIYVVRQTFRAAVVADDDVMFLAVSEAIRDYPAARPAATPTRQANIWRVGPCPGCSHVEQSPAI
jgi:hypothetical protein